MAKDKISLDDLTPEQIAQIKEELRAQVKVEISSEQIAEITAKVKEQLSSSQPVVVAEGYKHTSIASNEIPEDDLLDTPIHFYVWRNGYYIDGYTDKGQTISTPYNRPIVFREMPKQISRDSHGKRQELRWSSYACWSKKEAAFLRSCPYGRAQIILEQEGDLKQQDSRVTTVRMRAVGTVMALNKRQLIDMCMGRNISSDNDMEKMQAQLIDSLASEELGRVDSFARDTVERNNKELLKR